jgi:hypothetical protein
VTSFFPFRPRSARPPRDARQGLAGFLFVSASLILIPFIWRAGLAAWGPPRSHEAPSYLPALEAARERKPFVADPIEDLHGMAPGYVIIGDSMAGRLDWARLSALTHESVAPLLQNATGSAYWYLVFKNYVVASRIHPKRVVIFFRDNNLTDVMYRLAGPYRATLDEVALDREDGLDAIVGTAAGGPWFRVHRLVDRVYDVTRARAWLSPILTGWPAEVAAGRPGRVGFLAALNSAFDLRHLRPVAQADVAETDDLAADFDLHVGASVLPSLVALARANSLPLCFVRVLRRPVNGQPPPESAALRRYVGKLRAFLEAHGAALIDDRDDPVMATLAYGDGDHISADARLAYTDRFVDKLAALAR